MALRAFTFDGVDSGIYLGEDIETARSRPTEVHHSLDGSTAYVFTANFDSEINLDWVGRLPLSLAAALEVKYEDKVIGSLETTRGTCTAQLIRCDVVPIRADVSGEDYLAAVRLSWIRLSDFS